jgi:filamentous hemagglutinin
VSEQSAIRAGDGGFQVNVQGNTDLSGGAITSTQAAVDNNANSFKSGSLSTSDIHNQAGHSGSETRISLGTGNGPAGIPILPGVGQGSDSGNASSVTQAAITGIAGNTEARTGDQETGIAPIFDQTQVKNELEASTVVTKTFEQQAGQTVAVEADKQRKLLEQQLADATAAGDKDAQLAAWNQIEQVNLDERVANVIVGAMGGQAGPAIAQGALSEAASLMTQESRQNSALFPGIVDQDGKVLSNLSAGRLGGARIILDNICGAGNENCKTNPDGSLATNAAGQYIYTKGTWADYVANPAGQAASGFTGGIQGWSQGTIFGINYSSTGLINSIVEAFAGPHDYIGGELPGFYDSQGNAARSMSDTEKAMFSIWPSIAIPIAAPFAASTIMPAQVWNAVSVIIK